MRNELEAMNVQVVAANEARVQAIRYKPGTLDSLKAISLEDIDAELEVIKKRNSYIEQHYWSKQQNSKVGAQIRKNMGLAKVGEDEDDEQEEWEEEEPKKRVTIADEKKAPKSALKKSGEVARSSSRPKFGVDREGYKPEVKHTEKCGDCRYMQHESAIKCQGECASRQQYDCFECQSVISPRRMIHESKFEKYQANKHQK